MLAETALLEHIRKCSPWVRNLRHFRESEYQSAVQFAKRNSNIAAEVASFLLHDIDFAWPVLKSVTVTHSHDTRSSNHTQARCERKRQLRDTLLNFELPCVFSSGITSFLLPFLKPDQIADLWIYNHTLLAAYCLRLEYCDECSTRYTCDVHSTPVTLLPLHGDWTPLMGWLRQSIHHVRFDGMNWLETILFIEKSVNVNLLASRHIYTHKPTHEVNIFRALWRLVHEQRALLKEILQNGSPVTQHCNFSYATTKEMHDHFIERLQFAKFCIYDNVPSELARVSGQEVDTRDAEWKRVIGFDRSLMVISLHKKRITVSAGESMWHLYAKPTCLLNVPTSPPASTDTAPCNRQCDEPMI